MARELFKLSGVDEVIKAINQIGKDAPKVMARGVNRAARGGITDAVNLLKRHLLLKPTDIRKGFSIRQATAQKPEATIIGLGRHGQPLMKFKITPRNPDSRPKSGVRVQVRRFGASRVVQGAFVARMKSGHVGVFKRDGEGRLPVRELFGPDPKLYLRRQMMLKQLRRSISARLEKNLRQSLRYQVDLATRKLGRVR